MICKRVSRLAHGPCSLTLTPGPCWPQMLGVTLLLYGLRAASSDLAEKSIVFGLPLLGVATLLTLGSLADYLHKLWVAI